ncbi:MAG: hypothetical protein ACRENE_34055, partial [Polyangiaceae bacterium]
ANFARPGAPLAPINQGNQFGVFAFDGSGRLQVVWWNPTLGWLGPVALTSANYAPASSQLAVGTRANGEVDVYAVGSDGALKYMLFNGSVWSGPVSLTVGSFAPPGAPVTAALDVHGFMNVMVVGNDGAVYTKWDATPLWSGPTALTATRAAVVGGQLTAAKFGNASLRAFFVDAHGTLQTLSNAGSGWSGVTAIATHISDPGTAIGAGPETSTQFDVFVPSITVPSGLVESTTSGSGWSAPAGLPSGQD